MSQSNGLTTNQMDYMYREVLVAMESWLSDRRALATELGLSYQGERDLYTELGYPKELDFTHYWSRYDRDGLAQRVIDKPAKDSWRKPPIIKADQSFVNAVTQLDDRLKLWRNLANLDRVSGIGEYGVMLIGTKGDVSLSEPLEGNLSGGANDIIYLKVYNEKQATIQDWDRDPMSPRFSLPTKYLITLGEIGRSALGTETVHWSRVIHVAEDSLDGVYGRPRLKGSFNWFMDLAKVIGGSSEAAWRLVYKGLVISEKEGYDLEDSASELEDKFVDFMHKLKRIIVAGGIDVNELGNTEMPDPAPLFGTLISLVAADADMPQRILIGSERGELASTTDQALWAGTIANRQTQFCEPDILRPTLDWLIRYGAVPNVRYDLDWESIFELSPVEKVEEGERKSNIVARVAQSGAVESGIVTVKETRQWLELPTEPDGETVDDMLDIEDDLLPEVDALNQYFEDGLDITFNAYAGNQDDDIDEVYERYHAIVNMSASQLEAWSETDCSKLASLDRSPITRNLRLLRRNKDDWTQADVRDANRTISFVSRMREAEQGRPAREGCPSRRDISLRNWAYDPGRD